MKLNKFDEGLVGLWQPPVEKSVTNCTCRLFLFVSVCASSGAHSACVYVCVPAVCVRECCVIFNNNFFSSVSPSCAFTVPLGPFLPRLLPQAAGRNYDE